jgi:glycine/D-amino acid oxidase-like deaminating enzyme
LLGRTVTVIERATAGSQASGRAAGLFKSVQADKLRTQLARRSIERARNFADWSGVPLEVAASGAFIVARTDEHKKFLATEVRQSRGWGASVSEANPAELRRVSYYQASGEEMAVWCPEDIFIEEPGALVEAYVAACNLHGVRLLESEAAVGITLSAGRVAGVETTHRSLSAAEVVDAGGAWTRQVAELAGGRVAVAPVRHQLLVTEPVAELGQADPIMRVIDAAVYLRPARGGLMFGGFEPAPVSVDPRRKPASFTTDDLELDITVLKQLASQVAAETPAAVEAPVAEHRGGLFTMTPDGKFIAGPLADVPGLWVASGCNGSGFSSSLAIGEALAAWISDVPDRLDISALSPARFGPLTDDVLIADGIWQYAHYYDPAAPDQP